MSADRTREPQYQIQVDTFEAEGPVRLGLATSHVWRTDPRRLVFMLARYKFVSKMLAGYQDVLEVGCGDGFGAEIVLQEVERVHGVDFDPVFIEHCKKERASERLTFAVADLTEGPVLPPRDAAYSLDVIEHIDEADEDRFMVNLLASLKDPALAIIGAPSLEGQLHASEWSKAGHCNCKSGEDFRRFLERYFERVFLFSMNDEVVHTGFLPMAHYLLAVCAGARRAAGDALSVRGL